MGRSEPMGSPIFKFIWKAKTWSVFEAVKRRISMNLFQVDYFNKSCYLSVKKSSYQKQKKQKSYVRNLVSFVLEILKFTAWFSIVNRKFTFNFKWLYVLFFLINTHNLHVIWLCFVLLCGTYLYQFPNNDNSKYG